MTKIVLFALLATAVVGGGRFGGEDKATPLSAMVASERSFAKAATDTTTRDAFVAWFADDAVLMRPGPVNAQKWFADNPKWGLNGLLTWDPSFAFVSLAGDVGLSTGPWQFRADRAAGAKPVAYGFFVTVWVATPAGWRVKFDHGIDTPEPASPIAPFDAAAGAARPADAKADADSARGALELAESAFLRDVAQSPAKAYESALAADGRVYRPGHFPAVGKADATALVQAAATPNVTYTRAEAGVSRSADFAYVFGTAELAPARADAKPGAFLRVWRRTGDGGWRLALDVLDPPAAPK